MSREIKFRAWDAKKAKMHYLGKDFDYIAFWDEAGKCDLYLDRNHEVSEALPMQYTGMKDINGKEIYECDVLTCTDDLLWVVRYMEDRGFFAATNPTDRDDWIMLDDADFEIICNIYENPELLEK